MLGVKNSFSLRLPKAVQYIALSLCGAASFYGAWVYSTDAAGVAAVQVRERTAEPAQASASSPAAYRQDDQDRGAETQPVIKKPVRLASVVVTNPFGLLNTNAVAGVQIPVAPPVVAPPPPPPAPPPPPPVQVAAVVVEPPAPVAPPLPFVAIGGIQGKAISGGNRLAFLSEGGKMITVQLGDVIRDTYKVETITDKSVEFTYLPLSQKQTLKISN